MHTRHPPCTARVGPGARGTRWPSVGVIGMSGVVAALQLGKVSAALASPRADLGLDLEAAGWVLGLFALLGVVGGVPARAAAIAVAGAVLGALLTIRRRGILAPGSAARSRLAGPA